MVWYYRESDQEIGPVSKSELQNLVKSKQVSAQTLVKSVEMADWVPLIDVVRGKVEQPQSPPPPPEEAPAVGTAGVDDIGELTMEENVESAQEVSQDLAVVEGDDAGNLALCSQCGGTFPEDQVITFEDRMICASCKPMFVQKLKEGASLPITTAYGGFWIRALAYIIDTFIVGIVSWAIMMPLSMLVMPGMMQLGEEAAVGGAIILIAVYMLVSIGIPVLYFTFFHGRSGSTLGKMACGLKVVTAEGEPITYMRAFGRSFALWISSTILCIGFIMAGFDEEKRSLHDRMCSTRVIKKR